MFSLDKKRTYSRIMIVVGIRCQQLLCLIDVPREHHPQPLSSGPPGSPQSGLAVSFSRCFCKAQARALRPNPFGPSTTILVLLFKFNVDWHRHHHRPRTQIFLLTGHAVLMIHTRSSITYWLIVSASHSSSNYDTSFMYRESFPHMRRLEYVPSSDQHMIKCWWEHIDMLLSFWATSLTPHHA